MILDVGCGWDFKGDVNIDLFLDHKITKRMEEQKIYDQWKNEKRSKIPNFIVADCNNLPLRENSFDTVFCYFLLEHKGVDLNKTSKELLRVSRNKVVIQVPSIVCGHSKLHDKFFTVRNLESLFERYEKNVTYLFEWKHSQVFPFGFLNRIFWFCFYRANRVFRLVPCPVPSLIRCEVYK